MFTRFKKTLAAAALIGLTSVANAGLPFEIDTSVDSDIVPGASGNFTIDTAGATYIEDVTFTNAFTFDANILVNLTSFTLGGSAVNGTGLNNEFANGFGLYALIDVTGNFSGSGATLVLNGFAGALSLFIDPLFNTEYTSLAQVNSGTQAGTTGGTADDTLLGTSTSIGGSGIGDSSAGGFTLTFDEFELTTATAGIDGDEFFTAPSPFYTLGVSTGDLGNQLANLLDVNLLAFLLSGDDTLRVSAVGDTSVEFVPEPAIVSLLGLGILGLAFGARRK